MANDWAYTEAGNSRTGTMQCTACGKQITEGEYRYRRKSKGGDWGYVSQHRACSLADPRWAELDANREASLEQQKALSRACREFRNKWGVTELDEYIIDGDCDYCQIAALAQQPAAVDGAMARRLDDYLGGEFDIRIGKQAAHAALVHALATQHQEPTT